jgi:dTDP-4-dehydrorhamnose reductase
MRALVIGASGQVGAALLHVLRARGHEAHGTHAQHAVPGLDHLDLTDHATVGRAVDRARPDWIFCPAGLSFVDYCEDHPDQAMAANRDGPAAAARAAERVGAGFVYYSTDYVFDGKGGPFGEDDPPRPLCVYGRSKHEGEQAVLAACRRAVIVRPSVVYGPERQEKNFVYQLIRTARAGQAFRLAVDQKASPSYNPDVAAASVELAEGDLRGIWHIAGPTRSLRFRPAHLPGVQPGHLPIHRHHHGRARPEGDPASRRRAQGGQGAGAAHHAAPRSRRRPACHARSRGGR